MPLRDTTAALGVRRCASRAAPGVFFLFLPIFAQTTQGLISGRVVDQQTGQSIADASINYFSPATNASGSTRADEQGDYYLPQLSPGLYRIRIVAENYQTQEIHELELRVAG